MRTRPCQYDHTDINAGTCVSVESSALLVALPVNPDPAKDTAIFIPRNYAVSTCRASCGRCGLGIPIFNVWPIGCFSTCYPVQHIVATGTVP